tara:strand:- start:12138 stop:14582 length:2445 start_codon:yes stop_codon:yes gene_type:complete
MSFNSQVKKLVSTFTDAQGNKSSQTTEFNVPPMAAPPKDESQNLDNVSASLVKDYIGFPGEARGVDTVPIWARPDERLMNVGAEHLYGDTLAQMNEIGRQYQNAVPPVMYGKGGMKVPYYGEEGWPPPENRDYSWINDELLNRLAQVESGGTHINPDTGQLLQSPAGALGMYQWMPASAADPGFGVSPFDINSEEEQRQATAQYLRGISDHYKHLSPAQVLQAYNMGPSKLVRYLESGQELPQETIDYPNKILGTETAKAPGFLDWLGDTFSMAAHAGDASGQNTASSNDLEEYWKTLSDTNQSRTSSIADMIYGPPNDNEATPASGPAQHWMDAYADLDPNDIGAIATESQLVPLNPASPDIGYVEHILENQRLKEETAEPAVNKDDEAAARREKVIAELKKTLDKEPDLPPDKRVDADNAGKTAPKEEISKAEAFLKSLLGNLFDKDELKRAAIMYVGARMLGEKHGTALKFATYQYIGRVDEKEKVYRQFGLSEVAQKRYTKDSLAKFMKSYRFGDLIDKGAPMKRTGNFAWHYTSDGKGGTIKVWAEEVKIGVGDAADTHYRYKKPDNTYGFLDKHRFNKDPRYVKNTPEYDKFVKENAETYTKQIKSLRNQYGRRGKDKKTQAWIYADKLDPATEGMNVVKWALENQVDMAQMENLVKLAYLDMTRSASVTEDSSLEGYLNSLVIRQRTNEERLFRLPPKTDGEKAVGYGPAMDTALFNKTLENITAVMKDPVNNPEFANMSDTQVISMFINRAAELWRGTATIDGNPDPLNLKPEEREQWNAKAARLKTGRPTTGFYEFLNYLLANSL